MMTAAAWRWKRATSRPGAARRLDESRPGSGLGLSIVTDLAGVYGGAFTLDQSPLGGLRAILRLPGEKQTFAPIPCKAKMQNDRITAEWGDQ